MAMTFGNGFESALITGASSGIGRETATRLARRGYRTILVARNSDALGGLADGIVAQGGFRPVCIPADLSRAEDRDGVKRLVASEEITVAVFAAGYGTAGSFLAIEGAAELNMIEVNCSAVVDLTRQLAKQMSIQSKGTIVLFSSLVGWQGVPMSATYAATKAFIQSLGEALAIEFGSLGINVLCCAPGPVHSGFARRAVMTLGPADTAASVADDLVLHLHKKGNFVPGGTGKLLTLSLSALPRWLRVRVMGRIMSGMAKQH